MVRYFVFTILMLGCITDSTAQNVSLVSRIDYKALHDAVLNDCWGYTDETGVEYALVGTTKGTSIVSLKIPAAPVEVMWIPGTESIWRDLQVYKDYAYITTEAKDGLLIVDLRPLPANNVLPFKYYFGSTMVPFKSAHDIFVDAAGNGYLCGADFGNKGIIILDLHSDPWNPQVVSLFDTWYCHDAFAQGNKLYGAHIYEGVFSIIDISDIVNPTLIASQPTPHDFAHNIWATTDDKYVVTTDEVSGAFLTVFDVSNPSAIFETDRIQSNPGTNTVPHNAFIKNDNLIISSYYSDGITIHDMSRPHNLVQIGGYDTYPESTKGFEGSWGVYPFLPSGLLLASDRTEGLFVLQPTYKKPAYYEGHVRDAVTKAPLNTVKVSCPNTPLNDLSDLTGNWAVGTVIEGTNTITFSKPAYVSQTKTIDFKKNIVAYDTIDLVKLPAFYVRVIVKEKGTSNVIPAANIRIKASSLTHEDVADGFGERLFELYYTGDNNITVGSWGYVSKCFDANLNAANDTLIVELEKGIYDDFSFDFGWTKIDDGVRSGKWERGIPNGADLPGTAAFDAPFDCGDYAFVTGNGISGTSDHDDVDGGTVTLLSPKFNVSSMTDPHIHYSRLYFSMYGPKTSDDTMKIYLLSFPNKILVDTVFPSDVDDFGKWVPNVVRIKDFMPIYPDDIQLLIEVSDKDVPDPHNNITDGGFDHFYILNYSQLATEEKQPQLPIVYPNPVINKLAIKNLPLGSRLEVRDVNGRILVETIANQESIEIDCSTFNSGVYFLSIENEVRKFIKY